MQPEKIAFLEPVSLKPVSGVPLWVVLGLWLALGIAGQVWVFRYCL